MFRFNRTLLLFLLPALMLAACTKEREAKLPDGQEEDVHPIESFIDAKMQISTGAIVQNTSAVQNLHGSPKAGRVGVTNVQGSDRLKPMFADLKISGTGGSTVDVVFKINKAYITAFKVIKNEANLTVVEKFIATKYESDPNQLLLPIFAYEVSNYGKLVKVKDSNGEETSTLRLEGTNWNEATHVKVKLIRSNRIPVLGDQEKQEEIFLADKIDGSLFTAADYSRTLNINLNAKPDTLFYSRLNSSKLEMFEITTIDLLPAKLKDKLKLLKEGDISLSPVEPCTAELAAKMIKINPTITVDNCVIVISKTLSFSYVDVRRKIEDHLGTLGPDLEFPVAVNRTSPLIKITKKTAVSDEDPLDSTKYQFSAENSLVVKNIKGQEFLYRRTMQDSPNGFNYTFAGAAGDLEIVRFLFEKDQVKVVRSAALVETDGSTNVDLEVMMSLKAKYVKEVFMDESGIELKTPRVISTTHEDPKAIAIVDWTQNKIPNINSPLNYYALEQCFTGARDKEVSNVDQRLSEKKGMLNFTLASTYVSSPSLACLGVGNLGYFDTFQSSFTFKERISFMKYEKGDEQALLKVPYEAQKRLGFGMFTYSKKKPNENGNVGNDGTIVPLPAIFDLNKRKKITYVLAGLPLKTQKSLSEKIIKATQEVIDDWNIAFKKAFKNTKFADRGDVLELKVEGIDIDKATVGDLDRNYIYYVPKRTSSGVIGLGGSHPNPRSGAVESASVFIYGGNIKAMVESLKLIDQHKKLYKKNMQANDVNASSMIDFTFDLDAIAGASAAGPVANAAANANAQSPITDFMKGHMPAVAVDPYELISKNIGSISRDIKGYSRLMDQLDVNSGASATRLFAETNGNDSKIALLKALQTAIRSSSLNNPQMMEAIFSKAVLEMNEGKLSREEYRSMLAQVQSQEAFAKTTQNMQHNNICVYESGAIVGGLATKDLEDMSNEDIAVAAYKPTLAHEIGHNLGLRHNFIASFDKANFKHSQDDASERNYSSVMDYLSDDHLTYDGIGPYDVAAIRASYAGMLELQDGSLIDIEEYREKIGIDSWIDLTDRAISQLPLKGYAFCSDEDVGYFPACNRFDRGTSPEEIVEAVIEDYRGLYTLRNFPNDRIRFGLERTGSYIGRLFSQMMPLRQFLEETFFQAITGGSAVNENLNAAVRTMFFFHEIIRTPEAPGAIANPNSPNRFATLQISEDGSLVVERKYLQNQAQANNSSRMNVMGIEFDKLIALILLTQRDMGFPRYESISLRTSFPELERLIFEGNAEETPTLDLLTSLLKNNTQAATPVDTSISLLNGQFKVETTEMLRFYAMLGAMVNLDVNGLEASDNNSSLFRALSGFKAPEGITSIVQPGADPNNSQELRYWALPNAPAVSGIINNVDLLANISTVKAELVEKMQAWTIATIVESLQAAEDAANAEAEAENAAEEPAEPQIPESVKLAQEIDAILSTLPEAAGPLSMAQVGGLMLQVLDLSAQLEQGSPLLAIDQFETLLESLAKDTPIFAIAFESIPVDFLNQVGLPGGQLLGAIQPTRVHDLQHLIQFRNVETLSDMFLDLHPNFGR